MAMLAARLGPNMRLGNARLGYYQPFIRVYVNGVDRTGGLTANDARTVIAGAAVDQQLNHEPDTAKLRVVGFTPSKGQDVKIYLGHVSPGHLLFGGLVLNVKATGFGAHTFYDLDCIDYTWLLNQRKVTKRYTNQSATAIVLDLIASFSSGFTTSGVVADLPTIDEITFTNEDLSDALTRTMERIGGYWYADYVKDIHAFITATEAAGSIVDGTMRTARNLAPSEDLSQIITRVLHAGRGSAAATDVAVGSTTLPVEDATPFNASGGTVVSGPQTITYTALTPVAAPGAPTVAPNGTAGRLLGDYQYKITFAAFGGETVAGTASSVVTAGASTPDASGISLSPVSTGQIEPGTISRYKVAFLGAYLSPVGPPSGAVTVGSGGAISLGNIPTGPVGTTKRYLYRSDNGDSYQQSAIIHDNTTTGYNDGNANRSEEAREGPAQVSLSSIPTGPSGTTSRRIYRTAAGGSTYLHVADINDNVTTTYTDNVADDSLGDEPPTVSTAPSPLTGIPASGAGSIQYAIDKGDEVNLLVTRNDTAAQTALAGFLGGGDGIREQFYQDGRFSETEAIERADAILAERKDPIVTVTLESRDPTVTVGKSITIATTTPPAVSGTFKIQRVAITELAFDGAHMRTWPKRQIECSSKRFSFQDLLRQVSRAARERV